MIEPKAVLSYVLLPMAYEVADRSDHAYTWICPMDALPDPPQSSADLAVYAERNDISPPKCVARCGASREIRVGLIDFCSLKSYAAYLHYRAKIATPL